MPWEKPQGFYMQCCVISHCLLYIDALQWGGEMAGDGDTAATGTNVMIMVHCEILSKQYSIFECNLCVYSTVKSLTTAQK